MFTSQAPSLLNTLGRATDPVTARQLVQAFANCNQALTHRGALSLNPSTSGVGGGNTADGGMSGDSPFLQQQLFNNNYYGGDSYINNAYNWYRGGDQISNLYPQFAGNNLTNVSQTFEFPPINNNYASNWTTQMGDNNFFDFTTRQGDIVNNYAGPTFQVAGDTYNNNQYSLNQTVNNQTVNNQTVNNFQVTNNFGVGNEQGDPARGQIGLPGAGGPAGPQGQAGDPGIAGPAGPAGPGDVIFVGGGGGERVRHVPVFFGVPGAQGDKGEKGDAGRHVVLIRIKFPKITFDAEKCDINVDFRLGKWMNAEFLLSPKPAK